MGVHGCEASIINESHQKHLATTIKKTISNHNIHKDSNMTFVTSSHGPDIDPETVIFTQRINTLRRVTTKRQSTQALAKENLNIYIANGYIGTDTNNIKVASPNQRLCQVTTTALTGNHTTSHSGLWAYCYARRTRKLRPSRTTSTYTRTGGQRYPF